MSVSNNSAQAVNLHSAGQPIPAGTPNFFHAGYPKTASTWLYYCLREHPEVCVCRKDAIHWMTVHYHEGLEGYHSKFEPYHGEPIVADTTPSYACFSWSRQRLYDHNPNARILLTLRNPIERAFSHYWHGKKKRSYNHRFEDVLTNNVDIFNPWIAYGFYGYHLTELLKLFPRERIKVMLYDDLKKDPAAFCREVFEFLGIDADFVPKVLHQPRNVAWYRPTLKERIDNLRHGRPAGQSEYDRGMSPTMREALQRIYGDDLKILSREIGRDLSHWT